MIERYQTREMSVLWGEENKFAVWLEVELAVCRAWMEKGVIPPEAYDEIVSRGSFDIDRINEIEAQVNHDVVAFVSSVAEDISTWG